MIPDVFRRDANAFGRLFEKEAELPAISGTTYNCASVFNEPEQSRFGLNSLGGQAAMLNGLNQASGLQSEALRQGAIGQLRRGAAQNYDFSLTQGTNTMASRIVKVYIADPNPNVPLEKRILHAGEEHLTDSSDQELFFDVDIKALLEKHNEYRKLLDDKDQSEKSGRDVQLQPARIRDLKMVVVTIAQF